ncbi:MAG: hypothetical protein JWO93_332 [Micrococcaceae bacterium]|nr:hypothetical protein [Micrococcaceae bacterium]
MLSARDVYVCDSRQDRLTHSAPLVKELHALGVSCWIDEREIPPGESLISAINEGLRASTYVLIMVTDAFLGPGWQQHELRAAFAREVRTGVTVVIPVLDVDHDRFAEQYPLLADKLAIFWSDGIPAAANKIAALFAR